MHLLEFRASFFFPFEVCSDFFFLWKNPGKPVRSFWYSLYKWYSVIYCFGVNSLHLARTVHECVWVGIVRKSNPSLLAFKIQVNYYRFLNSYKWYVSTGSINLPWEFKKKKSNFWQVLFYKTKSYQLFPKGRRWVIFSIFKKILVVLSLLLQFSLSSAESFWRGS